MRRRQSHKFDSPHLSIGQQFEINIDYLHPGEEGFANGLAFVDTDKPKVDRLWIEATDGKTAVELTALFRVKRHTLIRVRCTG